MRRKLWIVSFSIVSIVILHGQVGAEPSRQIIPTSTPVQVNLPTPIPIIPTDAQDTSGGITSSSITRTPTPQGAALLEAITEANVRSQADPNADKLGTIRAGDTYTVVGKYYEWYEFQYDQSPNGVGWVFGQLVKITGNEANIPDLTLGSPTPDVALEQSNATMIILTQTPGGILTATAGVGALPLPVESSAGTTGGNGNTTNATAADLPGLPGLPGDGGLAADGSPTPLPTYTSPPNVGPAPITTALPSDENTTGSINTDAPPIATVSQPITPSHIPPILPILVLGGAGILGLAISSLRK